jgi:hypothetical protein
VILALLAGGPAARSFLRISVMVWVFERLTLSCLSGVDKPIWGFWESREFGKGDGTGERVGWGSDHDLRQRR